MGRIGRCRLRVGTEAVWVPPVMKTWTPKGGSRSDIDIPSSIRAMKDGAVDVLVKPFSEEQPLSAINYALQQTREATRQRVGPSSSADDSPETRLR